MSTPTARLVSAGGVAAALALLILLAAVLPRALRPSTTDNPEPVQTAGPAATPILPVATDPKADYLAIFMETAEWLRQDDVEIDESELRARLDALPIDELFAGAVHVDTIDELDTARCYNVGLIQAGPETSVNLSAVNIRDGGAVFPFGWYVGWESPEDVRLISSEEEFYAALEDRDCTLIGFSNGVSLTLKEDLILTKGLAITDGASLTMDGCRLTVAGENGYLCSDGLIDLRGSVLTVRDEAVALVSELRDCSGVSLRNRGYLMVRFGLRPNDGAVIEICDARYLCCIGKLELHGAQINIEQGLLRGTGGVELYGCTVDVGAGGEFLADGCGVYFDPDTVISNHGDVDFNGWDPQELACQFTNYGELSANEHLSISGSVVNYGHFRVWCGQDTPIRVSGSLENHGTVEFNNGRENVIARFQPWAAGTVTGVPDKYVANLARKMRPRRNAGGASYYLTSAYSASMTCSMRSLMAWSWPSAVMA